MNNCNIKPEEYQYCQQVWRDHQMTTFRDFLVWYNNLDVVPFIEALKKMSAFWREKKIDMLRQGMSVPGEYISVDILYRFVIHFSWKTFDSRHHLDLFVHDIGAGHFLLLGG